MNGITLYMSPRIEGLTGYPPERFLDSRDFWFTLVHPDDRERVEAAEEAANTTSSYLEEYRMVTADDRVVWVRDEAVLVPATERRPAHWIGLIVDITREKEAETRAAEVEQRYRTLIERLPIVTYIDAPGREPHQPLRQPSDQRPARAALRTHGRTNGRSGSIRRIATGRDRRRSKASAPAGRSPWSIGWSVTTVVRSGCAIRRRPCGTTSDEPEYVLGFFFDITQRKEAELRLEQLERRYRSLVEQLPAVTYMDTADADMSSIYVSPQVEKVLGLSADAFVTDDAWGAHLHPEDRERALGELREAIRAGDPFTLEYRMVRPDGSIVWIRDQGTVVKDEAGQPSYVQGLYEDISAQKRLESELRSEAVKFKSLAERIPAVVYIEGEGGSDDAPFYISPQYEELFGYTPEERQANPTLWRELLHPEDRARAVEAARALLRGGRLQRGLPDGGSGRTDRVGPRRDRADQGRGRGNRCSGRG